MIYGMWQYSHAHFNFHNMSTSRDLTLGGAKDKATSTMWTVGSRPFWPSTKWKWANIHD